MNLSIADLLAISFSSFGILLCLFVGGQLLARNEGVKQTNVFLALLLLLYAVTLANSLMAMAGLFSRYQFLYFLPLNFSIAVGPLFYFFVLSRIKPSFRFGYKDLVHFAVPVLHFLFYLSIGFRSAEYKSHIWRTLIAPVVQYVETIAFVAIGLGYVAAAILLIKKNENNGAVWDREVKSWLLKFAYWLLFLLGISFAYEVADWMLYGMYEYNLYNTEWAAFPLKMSYALVSFLIGYNAYIYQHQALITKPRKSHSLPNNLVQDIQKLFKEEHVYLDPDLNVEVVAKRLNVHKNAVSQAISTQNTTFRKMVNQHRVQEFVGRSQKPENAHLSLLGLAYDSGFNSKASFNRAFKEMVGVTPSHYMKSGAELDNTQIK